MRHLIRCSCWRPPHSPTFVMRLSKSRIVNHKWTTRLGGGRLVTVPRSKPLIRAREKATLSLLMQPACPTCVPHLRLHAVNVQGRWRQINFFSFWQLPPSRASHRLVTALILSFRSLCQKYIFMHRYHCVGTFFSLPRSCCSALRCGVFFRTCHPRALQLAGERATRGSDVETNGRPVHT